jgi:PAS domain S-box-containing protein
VSIELDINRSDAPKMPESLKIRPDLPVGSGLQAELEALRLRSEALRSAANAVLISDWDGTITWVNPAFSAMTGYTFMEAIGKNPRELLKSGKQEGVDYKNLWETIIAGRVWHGELVNRRKDGSLYNEAQTITPVRGLSGKITHFIAIKQDITKAKALENELKSLHAELHKAVEFSPVVHYTLKFEGKNVTPVYVSENIERILGVAAKDANSDWFRESIHPDDRERVMGKLASVSEGDGYSIDYRLRQKSGAYAWIHDRNRVVRDSSGAPSALNGIWLDISERRKAQEELQLFRALLDQSNDSIEVIDPGSGQFLDVNENALAQHGYSRAEFLALRVADLDPMQKEADWPRHAERIHAAGALSGDGIHRRRDGTTFPVEFSSRWVRLDRDYIVSVVRNVTTRKQAEAERQNVEIELRNAQKLESIGRLAAGIAHEINTPTQYIGDNTRFLHDAFRDLKVVIGQAEELLCAAEGNRVTPELLKKVRAGRDAADLDLLDAEIPKAIEQSLVGIERVTKIVRAMKEFSHPGSAEKAPLDINRAIETTLTVCRSEWKYVAEAATEFDGELPPVSCHASQFNQVILNLVVNAAHAIGDVVGDGAQGKGRIEISTRRAGEDVEIRVKDSGTGIPAPVQEHIFEPFFTTKGVGKGSGQGLALARSIVVEKHGGTIDFETEEGKGTTFIVRLPLHGQ